MDSSPLVKPSNIWEYGIAGSERQENDIGCSFFNDAFLKVFRKCPDKPQNGNEMTALRQRLKEKV